MQLIHSVHVKFTRGLLQQACCDTGLCSIGDTIAGITPKDKTRRKARNELPLEKRFQNVEEYENSKGLTGVRKFAEKFGCGKTQVSNILKQKTLVREEYERGFSSAKKRNSSSQYSNVNDAVWEWFKKKTEQRIPVEEARSQKSG